MKSTSNRPLAQVTQCRVPRLFLLGLILLSCAGVSGFAVERPNVVLILIDDLSYFTMPTYGGARVSTLNSKAAPVPIATPRIDQLAASGLRCDQAYVYPLCENTRVALMTGMHTGRNLLQPKALHASQITFSDVFKRAGYATGMYGKWKQTRGTPAIPALRYISEFGWDDYCCFDVVSEGHRYIDPNLVINGKAVKFAGDTAIDPATGRRAYGPDIINRAALKFINDHKGHPFFLYYPLTLIHDPHTPTPDTQPASAYDEFDAGPDFRKRGDPGDDPAYFPDMIAYTDKMIGNVIKTLDELGLRNKTLVIVMGDNGTKEVFETTMRDGRVIGGGKGRTKDSGERVGLIFNWPGRVPGGIDGKPRSYDGLIDVVDIYPTMFEACGIEVPDAGRIDGISAWPQVSGKSTKPTRQSIYHWYNANKVLPDVAGKMEYAFNADFKRYAATDEYTQGRFFDLRTDRDELSGPKGRQASWMNWLHGGLDLRTLTPEQAQAFESLGRTLEENNYVPVKNLSLEAKVNTLRVGEKRTLACHIEPANATRNNIIWVSSDPSVASVDKFGDLTAHKPGKVLVTVFSWDDAYPVSNGKSPEYREDGVQARLSLTVAK